MNLKDQLKKLLLAARAIAAKAEEEGRDFTADERQQVANLLDEANKVKAKIKEAEGDAQLKAAVMGFEADIDIQDGERETPAPGKAGKHGSIGERFVSSSEYVAWMKALGGRIPERSRGLVSPPVKFDTLWPVRGGRKALITGDSDTSAGAFVETDYTGLYEPLGRMPLNVLGLVNRRTTGSDLVSFVRQTRIVQEAAVVPEANVTDYAGSTGEVSGEKPEGTTTFEAVTAPVKTLAVWVPATRQALSDAAQIRGIIDQELTDDLNEEFEDQILNGDGSGDEFTGILNTSGILSQAWATDLLTTVRKARTALSVTGRSRPTAMVVHPNDAETLDLLKDDEGRFYFGGPAQGGVQQVWRVPVVESESITEGTGLMGDFRKAVVWDRMVATIMVSDSHADFFIRNMIAILAEMRAAFGVIRPSAFITVELESGS